MDATIIRTWDSERNPPHWTDMIRPGQYAVFLFDARTHVARDEEARPFGAGEGPSIALCDDLPEALRFANDAVTRHSSLCCEVYDHEGKSKDPLQVIYNPAIRSKYVGLKYAQRQAFWGSLVILCGMAFTIHDFVLGLSWIWGYVIGVKLTLIGGFRLTQGLLGWYEHRHES